MKKVSIIILAIVVAASFSTGCKKGKKKTAKTDPKKTSQKATPSAPTAAAPAPATGTPAPSTQAAAPQPATGKPTPTAAAPTTAVVPGTASPASPTGQPVATTGTPLSTREAYFYNAMRPDGKLKKNPFEPITVDVPSPPTQYEITQLGVNGVVLHGIKQASVMTPNCISTIIKIGDKIGVHEGEVVDITLEGVYVKETYLDMRGNLQEYERLIANQPYGCK